MSTVISRISPHIDPESLVLTYLGGADLSVCHAIVVAKN